MTKQLSEGVNPGLHHTGHLLALDGLRGVAAFAVVLFHRRWWMAGGHLLDHAYLAVDFFFMLSGLVIDRAYRARLGRDLSFASFLQKRAIRLYPLIFAGALLGLPLVMAKDGAWRGLAALPPAVLALPSLPALLSDPFALNQPSWSLFFEMLASIAFGMGVYRLGLRGLVGMAAVSALALAVAAFDHGSLNLGFEYETLILGVPRVAFPFCVGMIINRLRERRVPSGWPFWIVAVLLTLTFAPNKHYFAEAPYELAMVCLVYPVLIYQSCGGQPAGRWGQVAGLGAFLSYPVYAIHYPLYDWLERILPQGHARLRFAFCVAVIAVCAWIAGHIDERVRALIASKLTRGRARAVG